jgi:hypothetical protein
MGRSTEYESVSAIGVTKILYTYIEYVKKFGIRNKRDTKSQEDGNNCIIIVRDNQIEQSVKVRAWVLHGRE